MTSASKAPTVRSLIRDIQTEVRDTELQPDRAAELDNRLSALYGSVLEEVRKTEMAVNEIVRTFIAGGNAVNKAERLAKATLEYASLREAEDLEKLTLQLTR